MNGKGAATKSDEKWRGLKDKLGGSSTKSGGFSGTNRLFYELKGTKVVSAGRKMRTGIN